MKRLLVISFAVIMMVSLCGVALADDHQTQAIIMEMCMQTAGPDQGSCIQKLVIIGDKKQRGKNLRRCPRHNGNRAVIINGNTVVSPAQPKPE